MMGIMGFEPISAALKVPCSTVILYTHDYSGGELAPGEQSSGLFSDNSTQAMLESDRAKRDSNPRS